MKPILFAAALLLIAAPLRAADAPEETRSCAACHGENGVAVVPATPHLNGQLPAYLTETMVRLQKGRRASNVPEHIPATLGPDAINAIAAFYAGSKGQRPKQETDPAKVQGGSSIYFGRCVDCHADSGRVGGDEAPIMNAQNLAHLIAQGKAFIGGQRKFVEPLMRDAYKGLTAEDIEAVAHFLASIDQYPNEGRKKKRR